MVWDLRIPQLVHTLLPASQLCMPSGLDTKLHTTPAQQLQEPCRLCNQVMER